MIFLDENRIIVKNLKVTKIHNTHYIRIPKKFLLKNPNFISTAYFAILDCDENGITAISSGLYNLNRC